MKNKNLPTKHGPKYMTIKELKEKLSEMDENLLVMIRGYKGGYDNVNGLNIKPISLNVNDDWYYGPHANYSPEFGKKKKVDALIID